MNSSPLGLFILAAFLPIACSTSPPDTIEGSGTIEGTDIRVGSEVTGRISRIWIEEGTSVKKGDTLLTIDETEYQTQLRQSLANAEAAEATYRLAMEGSRKEDILQAEATFKAAEADYMRSKDLLASNTITKKQYDVAEERYVATKQSYEKLVRGLRRDEIVVARARRDQAVAQADLSRKKVRDCTVLAPSAGVVTLKAVEAGELVNAGSSLLRITRLDPVKLVIYINETNLGKVSLGQKADVAIDGVADRSFPGDVIYISSVAEFTPKNVQTQEERTKLVFGVKIRIPNPDGILKPGMPADARLTVGEGVKQ